MIAARLEEFGDYLLARGRINGWRIKEEGRYYRRSSLVAIIYQDRRSNNYLEVTDNATQKIRDTAKEDLPRALCESTNQLIKWYIEEKLKEA